MENQKNLNEVGGGRLPDHLEREIQEEIPVLMKPVLDYMSQKYNEYNEEDVRFRNYQKMFLLSTMRHIVNDLIDDIHDNKHHHNEDESMMNEAKEKLKEDFKRFL